MSLLKHVIRFYCFLGVPLKYPLEAKLVCWTVVTSTILIWGIYFGDLYALKSSGEGEEYMSRISKQPLVQLLFHLNSGYNIAFGWPIMMAYLLFYGRKIVFLLQTSSLLDQFYKRSSFNFKWTFILLMIITNAVFAFSHLLSIEGNFLYSSWQNALVNCFSSYIVFHLLIWPFLAVHYVHFASNQILKEIVETQKTKTSLSVKLILKQVQLCSSINGELNRVLSFPLLVSITSNSLDLVDLMCSVKANEPEFGDLVNNVTILLYIFYLSKLSMNSKEMLQKIKTIKLDKTSSSIQSDKTNDMTQLQLHYITIYGFNIQ